MNLTMQTKFKDIAQYYFVTGLPSEADDFLTEGVLNAL